MSNFLQKLHLAEQITEVIVFAEGYHFQMSLIRANAASDSLIKSSNKSTVDAESHRAVTRIGKADYFTAIKQNRPVKEGVGTNGGHHKGVGVMGDDGTACRKGVGGRSLRCRDDYSVRAISYVIAQGILQLNYRNTGLTATA